MANKLAGQRAKFSRARAIFYTSGDEKQRQRAAQLMAEVLAEAPANGFSEGDVTQGEDVPSEARGLATRVSPGSDESPEELINELRLSVEISSVRELGQGEQFVYAYGYSCAPDRLKLGSCAGDVVARIAAQISTGTPDKPALLLKIATHDCRALERALHAIFRLKGRHVAGAGAEWFIATPEEVVAAYERVIG
jgi:T5orf172 domain